MALATKKKPAKKTAPRAGARNAGARTTSVGTTKGKKTPAKKTPVKKHVKTLEKPKKVEKAVREFDEVTGYSLGSDSHTIASILLEGGESREEVTRIVAESISAETRNGTPKPVTNLVSGVLRNLENKGFTVEQSWILVPPTQKSARGRKR